MSTNFAPDAFDRAVIGVVGGMGPAATGQFLVELAAALGARRFAIEELRADDLVSVVRDLQDSGNSRKERR